MTNDLKFFTNEGEGFTLYDRFAKTLAHTKYFDILVGYFRSSGFHRLYKDFDKIEKVRILVGLNVDKPVFQVIEESQKKQGSLDFEQSDRIKDNFMDTLVREVEGAEDTKEVEDGILRFVEYLKNGKIEIKAHPSQNIHAKVYIIRHGEGAMDFGRVITGSSNFSESGLIGRREFNVELKDKPDVDFALNQFESLWGESIDITKDYIDTIKTKTPLNPEITPYDLYLKFLYEYFKEEINDDRDIDIKYPQNFMELKYQKEAVLNARRILKDYNGLFLADVVGLGKTYITSMLLQTLNDGQKLIICPPTLIDYWEETLREFYVPGVKVESLGKLDKLVKKGVENYDYVIIDEAHRFRNEMTAGFDSLYQICKNKKVVLVSATPLNNSLDDIQALLKLFMNLKNSPIPGMKNLEKIFADAKKEIEAAKKESPERHFELVKHWSTKVREQVLRHVMVRRTRTEIKQYYKDDLQRQGLSFPEMTAPEKIIYEFDDKVEYAFDSTIELLKDNNFRYARYTPLLYLKDDLNQLETQRQKNMRDFMKGILVKRLESSFFAFKQTIGRFADSYRNFIKMYKKGEVYIGKENVFDLLEDEDFARIEKYITEDKLQKYEAKDFKDIEERNDQCAIKEAYKDCVRSCKYLFKYITPDQYKTEIAVLAVHVANKHKLEKARSEQRNFIASFMKTRNKEAVLVAFYTDDNGKSDWRFSFVRRETDFDFDTHNPNKEYPGQHHWLELDNNPSREYMDDFCKPKVVWPRLMRISKKLPDSFPRFSFVREEAYPVDSLSDVSSLQIRIWMKTAFICVVRIL